MCIFNNKKHEYIIMMIYIIINSQRLLQVTTDIIMFVLFLFREINPHYIIPLNGFTFSVRFADCLT